MKKILLAMLLISKFSIAEQLQNVKILEMNKKENEIILKLRAEKYSADSYFFLYLLKKDPKFEEKYSMVSKKMTNDKKFNLNLNIISFSASPSGSIYSSNGVEFTLNENSK